MMITRIVSNRWMEMRYHDFHGIPKQEYIGNIGKSFNEDGYIPTFLGSCFLFDIFIITIPHTNTATTRHVHGIS